MLLPTGGQIRSLEKDYTDYRRETGPMNPGKDLIHMVGVLSQRLFIQVRGCGHHALDIRKDQIIATDPQG